jgi:hypothetical protein
MSNHNEDFFSKFPKTKFCQIFKGIRIKNFEWIKST